MIRPVGSLLLAAVVIGLVALGAAFFSFRAVMLVSPGNSRMQELGSVIRRGTMTFLRRQYTWVAVLVVLLTGLIGFLLPWGRWGAPAYVFGVLISAAAGLLGVRISTAANTRTAEAARAGGVHAAIPLAYRSGTAVGFAVSGVGLLGVATAYFVLHSWLAVPEWPQVLAAVCLGGSTIALFGRVGGGIYTKASDVGADLVGKVEEGIPEDDPRNPAVIADNVGDNVAVAGMGADLFESYVGALIAPVVLAAVVFANEPFLAATLVYPLGVGTVGMLASLAATFLVRFKGDNFVPALRRGTLYAAGFAAVGIYGMTRWWFDGVEGVARSEGLFLAVFAGLVIGLGVGQISAWFTSDHYRTVKEIARQSQTGAATVILAGMAEGMRSVVYSVLVVAGGIVAALVGGDWALGSGGGIYGISLAAIGALATLGMAISFDAYGSVADNATGIAEMAGLPAEARAATETLDALGNTTGAIAKGFATVTGALSALALLIAYIQTVGLDVIDLSRPRTAGGLFLGATVPFLFTSLTLNAVGRAASRMIDEVRRQFRDIPGLREGGQAEPDYGSCVDIATTGALREMLLPGALAIVAPLALGFADVEALAAFLIGSLIGGFLLAAFMANSGGAWDNAKKLIEAGAFGGKGSIAHNAAVVGDGVGDPFKDTTGPALSVLSKVMTIVALVFSSALVG